MAQKLKLQRIALGRPAILTAPPLVRIWLIATHLTPHGNAKAPIDVRVEPSTLEGSSEAFMGWPTSGRWRLHPWEWKKAEWRRATPAETAQLEAQSVKDSNGDARKTDTTPAPPPVPSPVPPVVAEPAPLPKDPPTRNLVGNPPAQAATNGAP